MNKNLLVLGSGPAGLTSAIYGARGGLDVTVVSGLEPGGQLMLTTDVENFPGFEEPVLGPVLMKQMRGQAQRLGVKFVDDVVKSVDFSNKPFKVAVGDQTLEGGAVIVATGASSKWIGLESEQRLRGKGVSSCATCDGFFFKEKDIVLVGGGDVAMEDANFLTKFAKKVTVIHRRNELRASHILQQRAFSNEKITFIWDSVVEEILGKDVVEGVKVKNVKTGELSELKCHGVFVAIGHKPNTDILQGQLELDEKGYAVAKEQNNSSVKGVFVAGDVFDHVYRQAVTAAGSGCSAAMDAIKYLEEAD
ncbi:MAG: thioredoxin-disulfide reductase [Thaumarchaeota archaeon]|nr:thioredoxin-disulfide reductase [Nitrososphaerota archaeon]